MRWVSLLGLIGCSYQAPAGTGDDTPDADVDAPASEDAPPDAPADTPAATCTLGATGATTDRGKVGLSNGGNPGSIACDGDTRIVGIALDMSDGLADGVTRSARGIRIACATVTIDPLGGHTGTIATKDVEGAGGSGWTPSTFTSIAQCPEGAVVSGLAVHGSSFTTYFLDATMACTRFDTSGNVAQVTGVYIAGSLTDPMNPSEAHCAAGEQVTSMATSTGAGLDSLRLVCAATQCR